MLSRQGLAPLEKGIFGSVENGAYLLKRAANAKITFVASGSEVELCVKASELLAAQGIGANVVSAPCFDLLCEQPADYVKSVLDPATKIIAVEAASALEWYKFANEIYAMKSFGESDKADALFDYFGFTAEKIAKFAAEAVR